MEDLAPTLKILFEVELALASGESVRTVLNSPEILETATGRALRRWYATFERTGKFERAALSTKQEKAMILLFKLGLQGRSIVEELNSLQEECWEESRNQILKFAELLPFKLLFPIALFVFPALMMMILGPILSQILNFGG
ncbi:MAG: type II secretion system F family protein [Bdellovibrionales bacterium]|nr:type II secretion system F family protein [Bdellovibrionales bacterium]